MDVRKILKIYNHASDEKRSRINIKFAGALVAFLVVGAGLFAVAAMSPGSREGADSSAPSYQSQRRYVGLPVDAPVVGACPDVNATLQAWQLENPDYVIEKKEEVRVGACLIGFQVTYHLK
jgi:hypothetical protein